MAFMLFKKEGLNATKVSYGDIHEGYKLAGNNNLLCGLWNKKNKPIDCGWSVTADDLLSQHRSTICDKDHALVIDFHPSARNRIGLVEIEAIHVYTYGDNNGHPAWSPMMLELRDVYYEEFDKDLTPEWKQNLLQKIELSPNRKKIVEFLYLQGGWRWGRNGSTNAAFIHDGARTYFQRAFNS